MDMLNTYYDCSEAFLCKSVHILTTGEDVITRGMLVKELRKELIIIENPLYRCYFLNGRNDNIFAKIAETLWMLAGRDDIEWLSHYLPRAVNYSDNGKTWRGAYGPRLRRWNGSDKMADQLKNVHDKLVSDPDTRQAVISIFDPSEDYFPTKDVPCNNWLHFMIRNCVLDLNIAQRSCDLLWGYSGIDTFSWSVLLQMMAYWTSAKVGTMTHFISSLHLYEEHWKRVNYIDNANSESGYYSCKVLKDPIKTLEFSTSSFDFDDALKYIFDIEKSAREEPCQTLFDWCDSMDDHFLRACAQMLIIYSMRSHSSEDIGNAIMMMEPSDLRLATIEYMTRDRNDLFGHLYMEKHEELIMTDVYQRF